MAVLWVNTVQLVVRSDSNLHRFSDLRGRRVGVGPKASGTEISSRTVVEGHGLKYGDVIPEFLSFSEVVSRMEAGTLDAGFVVASYPVAAVSEMNRSFGIRLLPIGSDVANRIRTQYPFMRPVTIPKNTYSGQTDDIETVGIDNILICRSDLPEQLVYRLTKTFFDSLPELARTDLGAALIDPEQGPTTPIPLHAGAARFYREREILR
jgi:TRAP transporter TAXI family solute receptor